MRDLKKTNQGLLLLFLLVITAMGMIFSTPATGVSAQEPTPSDNDVNAIASRLFCPVCQNTPLDVCDTEACRQWRDLIRQMLSEGKTEEEIFQYFTENYGIRVLSEPPTEGFNWLVYLVPPVAFLMGLFFLFRAFVTWKKVAAEKDAEISTPVPSAVVDDPYAESFQSEVKKRE